MLKRGVPVSGLTMESARPILRTVNENVLLEIQKTFDFFRSTTQSDRIDRVVVSGGASRVDGFTEMLAERFDVDVEAFDPFKTISFEPAKFGVDSAADVAATSAVAVGLALRRVGDR
jgi:type IV pilus assembly protein PilM